MNSTATPVKQDARAEVAAVHMKPRLQEMLASLRLDITYERADGDHLFYRDDAGREVEVLDFVGGFGSLLLGHSHPELVAEAQHLLAAGRPVYVQGSNREYAQRLAVELSRRAGGDYSVVFGNSGAEGVEAAMKHAMFQTGSKTFIALEGAFHGKTLGALQLTHNPFYREAFAVPGIRVLHVAPDDIDALEDAFEKAGSEIAGFVYEPVLGEGGVRPLLPEFAQRAAALCRKSGAALIADECQTGLGRTGHFLASETLGVEPDYIVLSKALGGGLAKISACLVRRESYRDRFDLRHTSTFADDDYSCAIALKTLELIDGDFLKTVRCKGDAFLAQLRHLKDDYPDVIREVRGAGLMLGVEFHPFDRSEGFILRYLSSQEELVKLIAGYLLRVHRIRVLPMLSDPFTMRLQPSALLTDADAARFVRALKDVCARLRANDVVGLARFLKRTGEKAELPGPVIAREQGKFFAYNRDRFWRREKEMPKRRVAWLCHLVDSDDLVSLEPGLSRIPAADREAILKQTAGSVAPVLMSSVDIRSRAGEAVRLDSIMLPFTSSWVKSCMDAGDLRLARTLVQHGVDLARRLGCSMAALGQYTSIITANGTRLDSGDMGLTTGNSYAVGLAMEAVTRAMRNRGIDPSSATLAVVGAAGNIGRTCATIMAQRFRKTVLIGSDTPGARARLQPLADKLSGDAVRFETDLRAVRGADVVVSATNAAAPPLCAAHFQPHAVVCDLSVPVSVHPDAPRERPDALFIKGGVARLPFGDDLELPGFPLPHGQTFACMAEGILLGMDGVSNREFTGSLRPRRVLDVWRIARRHGFELAGYKTECVLGLEENHAPQNSAATASH
jgi:acetylornithine/succinyldiaminopimelate/putrescine aminotransferase/predicted amino acid dehydrogenase